MICLPRSTPHKQDDHGEFDTNGKIQIWLQLTTKSV